MTHVGVNLLWLAPGRVGGSEEYLVRQLTGLADAAEPDLEVTLFCQPSLVDRHPDLTSRHRTVAMPFDRDWRGARVVGEHTWLAVNSRSLDVMHHGGGTVPMGRAAAPIVLTVHDLQYLAFPHYFGRARRRYLGSMMPRSVTRAAVVATPTRFVRDTVIRAFGADPDRVVVVPHGIPSVDRPAAAAIATARRRHGVSDRPYVVYPAITHPHKGHRVLVEMLAESPDLQLVLVGGEGAAEASLRTSIERIGVADRVVRTGRIPAADRDALVAGADALVFPSEYEGFGAPVVEAMELGTPVVCSAAPALREVVGDAGIVVERDDPGLWAESVDRARSEREQLVDRGLRRRGVFTLAASGSALASAYRLAAS